MTYLLVRPDSKLSYTRDWTDYLAAAGTTIATHQWSIEPAITLVDDATDTVEVSGFLKGVVYRLTDFVVLANGDEDAYSITIRCDDR